MWDVPSHGDGFVLYCLPSVVCGGEIVVNGSTHRIGLGPNFWFLGCEKYFTLDDIKPLTQSVSSLITWWGCKVGWLRRRGNCGATCGTFLCHLSRAYLISYQAADHPKSNRVGDVSSSLLPFANLDLSTLNVPQILTPLSDVPATALRDLDNPRHQGD